MRDRVPDRSAVADRAVEPDRERSRRLVADRAIHANDTVDRDAQRVGLDGAVAGVEHDHARVPGSYIDHHCPRPRRHRSIAGHHELARAARRSRASTSSSAPRHPPARVPPARGSRRRRGLAAIVAGDDQWGRGPPSSAMATRASPASTASWSRSPIIVDGLPDGPTVSIKSSPVTASRRLDDHGERLHVPPTRVPRVSGDPSSSS
jgi:hypothetical protein